jgi:hypothetical protein
METAPINCPTCGAPFPAGANFCSKCGYTVPETITHPGGPPPTVLMVPTQTPATNWAPWIAGIVVVLLAVGGGVLWNMGYLGGAASTPAVAPPTGTAPAEPPPTAPQNITINTPPAAPPEAPPQNITINTPPPATPPAAPPAAEQPVADSKLEIVSVSAKVLETGEREWKEGYELKLRNLSNADMHVNIKIQFLDAKGFVVDDDLLDDLLVPANSEKSFADADVINADVAATIKSVKALQR